MQARQKDQHILVTDNLPALLRTEKTSTIPTSVTTIAICPLLGQWFNLRIGPIYAVFAYARKSCQAVLVGVKLYPVGNFGTSFITIHCVGR